MPATVENIVSYGAFLRLEDGCSGFVHISQVESFIDLNNWFNVTDITRINMVPTA